MTAIAASIIVGASRLPDTPFPGMSERGNTIGLVQPGGPADQAGLRVGDTILAVDGLPVRSLPGLSHPLRSAEPGDVLELTVLRDGATESNVPLLLEHPPRSEVAWDVARAVAALIALFVGSVVWMRRAQQLTFVFFLICLTICLLLFFPYVASGASYFAFARLTRDMLSVLFPALFVHFFLLFPYERAVLRRRPVLIPLLYAGSLVLFALEVTLLLELWPKSLQESVTTANALMVTIAFAASFIASIWLFTQAFRRTSVPSIRRKLRVALWGTIIGVIPIVVVVILHGVFPGRQIPADRLAVLALVLIPMAFGYAIVRHGVFDFEWIVKRSLVITGLTAVLILLYFLSYFLLRALLHTVTALPGTLVSIIAFLFVILLFSPIRTRIEDFVDRSFYPERFESRRQLREFARSLPHLSDEKGIIRACLESAARTLGIERGAYFPERRSGQGADYSWGIPAMQTEQLQLGSVFRDPVVRRNEPLLREEIEADLPYGYIPESDNRTLSVLDASLLVPIATRGHRFGVAVLGRRIDGDAYSSSDLDILESLASQTALAMENARFQRELETKEAIARELVVAQTVQRQLLPQTPPSIPGVEITAVTLPCHEVGGDYFDYVITQEGKVSIAVGDVSGKGIPAAILMANVQALFRAEARGGAEPDQILDQMNRRLCEIEGPERFVSFFCALFDPERREIRHSSAGHPPPMLVRFDGSLHHLDAGGLLLGIEPEVSYPLGVIRLRTGDLILCYTDGIPDPLSDGSPLREDQLEEMIRNLRHLPASRLLDRIIQRIREGPALEDDTTLLILKVVDGAAGTGDSRASPTISPSEPAEDSR